LNILTEKVGKPINLPPLWAPHSSKSTQTEVH